MPKLGSKKKKRKSTNTANKANKNTTTKHNKNYLTKGVGGKVKFKGETVGNDPVDTTAKGEWLMAVPMDGAPTMGEHDGSVVCCT